MKEAQNREMFEDVPCILRMDRRSSDSTFLASLEDHLGPKFLGGDLEDLRAIDAVPGEREG